MLHGIYGSEPRLAIASAWLREVRFSFYKYFRLGMLAAILAYAGGSECARAQDAQAVTPPKPPTAIAVRKSCLADHEKFCAYGTGGTASDVACLQQHHIGLDIKCRNVLSRLTTKPDPTAGLNVTPSADQ